MPHTTWDNDKHVLVATITEDPDNPIEWEITHPETCLNYKGESTCPIRYEAEGIGTAETMFGFTPNTEEFISQPIDEYGPIMIEIGRQLLHSDEAVVQFGAHYWGGQDYWGEWDYGFEFWPVFNA